MRNQYTRNTIPAQRQSRSIEIRTCHWARVRSSSNCGRLNRRFTVVAQSPRSQTQRDLRSKSMILVPLARSLALLLRYSLR